MAFVPIAMKNELAQNLKMLRYHVKLKEKEWRGYSD